MNAPPDGLPLAQLLDGGADGVFAFDDALRFTFWNQGMERLTGIRREEAIGRDAATLFPYLRDTGEIELMRAALTGRRTESKGHAFAVPETDRRGTFDGRYFPLRDARGAVTGGGAVVCDRTEQNAFEQQVRETERRFRAMADSSPVLLWMSGLDANCDFFNQTWLDFTGRAMAEELGVGWAEGVHFEDLQRCMDTYLSAFESRVAFQMEYRLRRRDGEYRWILDTGVPRVSPEGTFLGYVGSCVDITERVELDRLRTAHVEELGLALKSREEFISVASHELRTPLTSLRLQTQLLGRLLEQSAAPEPERLRAVATVSERQVERLIHLVDVMLDVSRISGGHLRLERAPADLSAVVREVADRLRPDFANAECALALRLASDATGFWDAIRLEQVVVNLLTNAMKYGAGQIVAVEVAAEEREARLMVRDSGRGIAPEDQERIFRCFERAVPGSEVSGLGIGLYIAKQIVEAHDGRISVQSAPGKGATFTVTLPRSVSSPA